MPKQKRDVDKMTGQKKNNYQVINPGSDGKPAGGKIPKCACDRKRCLKGRCGVWWMVITGLIIAVGIFFILWISDALGFDFETSGTETLYDVLCANCTDEPTSNPTIAPTADPTTSPSDAPTVEPTYDPTADPTLNPTDIPTVEPTSDPTSDPTTEEPTSTPTYAPTSSPTVDPTSDPTSDPTIDPSNAPTTEPTDAPTGQPTNEPSEAPTTEPTADPTSERRRSLSEDMVANVILVTVDGTTFDYSEFETPEVDEFLTEGYTFNNLKNQFSLAALLTGKNLNQNYLQDSVPTWAEQIGAKGYKNYYYGSWMIDTEVKLSTPLNRGWDFFYGTAFHADGVDSKYMTEDDLIMEKVQSRLQKIEDLKWSITVNWTAPFVHDGIEDVDETETPVFGACSRYFLIGGTDFDYQKGVRCQWTMEYDTMFGKVLETLKSTGLWSQTIVLFVIGGRKNSIFSVNGGALPGILLSRTNEDRHSMLDVVPTILAVCGFSDQEVASAKLDGFPISGLVNNIKDSDE